MKGSGDNGRIIKRDIDSYKPKAGEQAAAPVASKAQPQQQVSQFMPAGEEGYRDISLSQMRKVIAQRLSESKFSAPHFYLRITVTMDKAAYVSLQPYRTV